MGTRKVISTTPEQDERRKEIIHAYITANPTPDEALLPELITYTHGKNKYLGNYTKFHNLKTGEVEYKTYPERTYSCKEYNDIYKRIYSTTNFNNGICYLRMCNDDAFSFYARYVEDAIEPFLEVGICRIPINAIDKSKNVDKRKFIYWNRSDNVFLFKNDPMPYSAAGKTIWPNGNNTKYNKEYVRRIWNLNKNGQNNAAYNEMCKFFNISGDASLYRIVEAYKNMKEDKSPKTEKLKEKGVIKDNFKIDPKFEETVYVAADDRWNAVISTFWDLEDAPDGGKYLINYKKPYNYTYSVGSFLRSTSKDKLNSIPGAYTIGRSEITWKRDEYKVIEHPQYFHISPKGEVSKFLWNESIKQYQLTKERFYVYGSSMFIDINKWRKDPYMSQFSNFEDDKEYNANQTVEHVIQLIRNPLKLAIYKNVPNFLQIINKIDSKPECEAAFSKKINWRRTDYEKELGFTKDQLKTFCLYFSTEKAPHYKYIQSCIKAMHTLYPTDEIFKLPLEQFKSELGYLHHVFTNGIISATYTNTDRYGIIQYNAFIYRDFLEKCKKGINIINAWKSTRTRFGI